MRGMASLEETKKDLKRVFRSFLQVHNWKSEASIWIFNGCFTGHRLLLAASKPSQLVEKEEEEASGKKTCHQKPEKQTNRNKQKMFQLL